MRSFLGVLCRPPRNRRGVVLKILEYLRSRKQKSRANANGVAIRFAPNEEYDPAPRANERSVTTNIGGLTCEIASDDNYLNVIAGNFEPDMVRLFEAFVQPEMTVLDIGANIGCTTILFGQRAQKVISFEPSPTTFHFLQKNTRAAGVNNVVCVNSGLGKTAGSFELTFSTDNRSGGFVSDRTSASAGHEVESIDIRQGDHFVRENVAEQIGFIKIDVEGFEQNVIEGLAETLRKDKPAVVLELNHWCLNVLQRSSVPDFLDFLRSVFPYLYAIDGEDVRDLHNADSSYHVMYHHIVCGFKYPNLVGAFNPKQLEVFRQRYKVPER